MPDEEQDKKLNPSPEPQDKHEVEEADPKLKEELEESKDELSDKLDTPGGLEVEEMPESNDLMKRRAQMKKRLKELAKVEEQEELGTSENQQPFEVDEGGLMAILKEANLQPKHLKFCCGGILVFLLGVLMVWGGIALLSGDKDKAPKKAKKEVVKELKEENTGEPIILNESLEPGLYSAVLVGSELTVEDSGVKVGEDLGTQIQAAGSFAEMAADFTTIYHSLDVDVLQLVDQSRERAETLDTYLDELQFHLFLARGNHEALLEEANNLKDKINGLQERKDEKELEFFEDLRGLDAYGSDAALNQFMIFSEELVVVRAKWQARSKLLEYYEVVIQELELRIKEIELNREAIVKGVKVVEIRGADIDLIIDESEFE